MTSQSDESVPPATAPHRVRLATNVHHWDNISFLHWPYQRSEIARLVPEQMTVLTHEGMAWVGVTPFFIRVRPPGVPVSPPGWSFPETNVRTYVAGPDGREGVWFLHMEVPSLWFTATLRSLGFPYVRQRMTVDVIPERVTYDSVPRPPTGGGHKIIVRPGEELRPLGGGPRERFFTARWAAYHRQGRALFRTAVEHPPWPLRAAEVERCEVDGLFGAAGLPIPVGPPVVHFSPGVTVRVGTPRLVT